MALQRPIGLIGLTFIGVSGVIGSGWMFAPLMAAQQAGPASLVSWVIGGLAMLILALTFAEITAMLPVAGGLARVPQFAYGNVVAVAMGWTAWVGYLTTAPIETVAMLQYLAHHAPWLFTDADNARLSVSGMVAAGSVLAVFTYVNAVGVAFFARLNTSITWFKLVVPVVIMITLMAGAFRVENFSEAGGFAPMGIKGILAAVSTGGIAFAFIGFRHAIDMAGETHDPGRNIPRALILSVVICLLIYVGIQVAFIGALSEHHVAQGWGAVTFNQHLGPLEGLALALGYLWLVSLLYSAAVISPFGGALVAVASNARLTMAMSQNRFFPALLASLSLRGVPLHALLINFVFHLVFLVAVPFKELVTLNSAALVLSFCVGPLGIVALRRILPERPRPFRLPAALPVALAGFIVVTFIVYWSGWDTMWRLAVALGVGLLVYAARIPYTHGPESRPDWRQALWLVPYLLGLGVISFLGSFGGGQDMLPFGWDLLACTVLAVAVFALAIRTPLDRAKLDQYLAEENAYEAEEYGRS